MTPASRQSRRRSRTRGVPARCRAKVATVPGSECLWWTGAVAGRSEREGTDGGGHGGFWYAPGRVIISLDAGGRDQGRD
jgi:hypothetical protein